MDHIHLAQWADIVVVAPATSNLINKFATGIADDAVTSLWQAAWGRGKPMLVVPAMNTRMWEYPATQENLAKLQSWGAHILKPAQGDLACGEQGDGRMLEVDDILKQVDSDLQPSGTESKPKTGRRILVTAGGTREPIDSVRYIGNLSSGRTAAALCDALSLAGHEVCWLGAESAHRPRLDCEQKTYVSFVDLQQGLQELLAASSWDAVIHAAAVSDYSVDRIEQGKKTTPAGVSKLSSEGEISIHLKPNPKLLDQIRNWSCNPRTWIIGFKLTDTTDPEQRSQAILRLFDRARVDAVVHNDLHEMKQGQHPFSFHSSAQVAEDCTDVEELGNRINKKILELAS
jgi:phosphopantothenoylcysteine decarboxylase/phosphopantothenate--cysteine ligase